MEIKCLVNLNSVKLFRDFEGKWRLLARPGVCPGWLARDVARIGADTDWYQII